MQLWSKRNTRRVIGAILAGSIAGTLTTSLTDGTSVMGYLFEFLPVPPAEVYRSTEIGGMRVALTEPPGQLM